MGVSEYVALNRQSGLMREMQIVANNIANISTTGFRKEGLLFSEYVVPAGDGPSLSMANANVRLTSPVQGAMTQTGNPFDLAIEGEGFFMVETPAGNQITRAGSFTPGPEGELVTPDGYRLLDAGGAPIFVPPDARAVTVAADGTLSADGRALAQIGLYLPSVPAELTRQDGVRFSAASGYEPAEGGRILQGFLEGSNVNAVQEIARMIEVQRAYELGQALLEREDERLRGVVNTLGRQ